MVEIYAFLDILLVPVPSSVKKIVCGAGDNFLLEVRLVDFSAVAIVEFIPFLGDGVFSKCSVMAETHVTEMIGDSIAIVNH